jgi:soluble lytic murein transglycosylase-like protein
LARSWANFGSNLYLSSRQAGTSVSTLQGLGNAAQIAGGSADAATSSFVELNRNMQLARAGHGDQNFLAGMGALGIDWNNQSSSQAMDQVLHKLAGMHNVQQQLYFGNAILGGSFAQLWPIISQGTQALDAYLKQGQDVGVLSEQQAQQALQLRGDFERLGLSVVGLGNQITSDLFPGINSAAGGMTDWLTANQKWLALDITKRIQDITGDVEAAKDAVGGWNHAFELIAGYVAGSWALKMIGVIMPIVRLLALIPGSGVTAGAIAATGVAAGAAAVLQSTANGAFSQLPNMTPQQQAEAEASALAGGYMTPDPSFSGLPTGPGASDRLPGSIASKVRAKAAQLGLDQNFIEALAYAEAGTGKVSSAGAIGTMQLLPGTANDQGVNPYDEDQNIQGGENYFQSLLKKFGGNYDVAAAAYNAGPNNPGVLHYAQTGDASQLPAQTKSYIAEIDDRFAVLASRNITHTVNGNAQVHIKLSGAPAGTRVSSVASGNLFGGAPRVEMPMPAGGGP